MADEENRQNVGVPGADPVHKEGTEYIKQQTEQNSEGQQDQPSEQKGAGGKKSMENVDSIPTAGGERLGEKHWGESEVVPDNPKPKGDEGVASADGQPTDEVANNTAKNTGGATGEPNSGEEKTSLVDKIKAKLPGGN